MTICPKCGTQCHDGTAFCQSCGASLNAPRPSTPTGKLHCPQCRGTQLSPIVESSITGGVTGYSSNGRVSSTSFSNVHRNYWVCQNCGNKFRNIQNLQEELAYQEKRVGVYMTSTIISLVIGLLGIILMSSSPIMMILGGAIAVGGAITALCYFVARNSMKKSVEQMKQELAYLQANCF